VKKISVRNRRLHKNSTSSATVSRLKNI
jgi:hypothetical protein